MYIHCVLDVHKMYSKLVTEPADRECDDLWAGHYVIAPMRDHIIRTHERERERDTEKDRERDKERHSSHNSYIVALVKRTSC